MAKRYYVLLLCFFLVCLTAILLIFTHQNAPISFQPVEKYNIRIILKSSAPTPAFWRIVEQGVDVASKEFEVSCQVTAPKSEIDVEGQIKLVEEAIAQKPDAIVLAAADYDRLAGVCKKAVEQGIRLITVDSDVNYDKKSCFVGIDNYELGKKLAQQVDLLIGPEEQFGVIGHVSTVFTAIERRQGLLDNVRNADRRLADIQYCNSSEELAKQQTIEMLQKYPSIRCMVGLNESSAVGICKGLTELGLAGKIKVVACDSSTQLIQYMEMGTVQVFVVQNPFNMGYVSVKQAVRILQGKKIDPAFDTGSVVVTRENLYTQENQKLLFPFTN